MNPQSVTISLNGKMASRLDWKAEIEEAKKAIENGYKLLFDLDLGLFDKLTLPLHHEAQFQALSLSMEHLLETFIIPFEEHIAGVILFRGKIPFHLGLSSALDPILDRDKAYDFLQLLADQLPEMVAVYALIDAQEIQNPLLFYRLTSKDSCGRISLIITNEPYHARPQADYEPKVALLLPRCSILDIGAYKGLNEALTELISSKTPFKVISEGFLAVEWAGIDRLIVQTAGLTIDGKRMIQGFIAAGGEVSEID